MMQQPDLLKNLVRHTINGSVIDYLLRYDITGKVYEARPLLYDLPKNSQRLILGENSEETEGQIEHFRNLLTLILPLGIVNQDSFFSDALAEVYTSINQYLDEHQLDKNKLYTYAEPESMEYYILSAFQNPGAYPDDFIQVWTKTIALLKDKGKNTNTDNIRYLTYKFPQFGFKILPFIIPLIKTPNVQRIAYEGLSNFVDPACKQYLLDEMVSCKDGLALSGLFKALAAQNLKGDDDTRDKIIDIYRSDIQLSEDALANMMEALSHIPNEEVHSIGLEIIEENKRHSGGAAARYLLKMGFPAKKIVDITLPNLHLADPKESGAAFAILCHSDRYAPYLPPATEILDIYVNTMKKGGNLNISYCMPSMIRRKADYTISPQIAAYLDEENHNALEGILILIRCLMNDKAYPYCAAFYTEKAKQRYIALLDHPQQKVVENALKIIQKIGKEAKEQHYIGLFLNKIDLSNGKIINLHFMWAINHILPVVKYEDGITPVYLEALKNTNSNYRVAALNGLRYSRDKKLFASLAYLEDDPHNDVRRALKRLDEDIKENESAHSWEGVLKTLGVKKAASEAKDLTDFDSFMKYLDKKVKEGEAQQKSNISKFKLTLKNFFGRKKAD